MFPLVLCLMRSSDATVNIRTYIFSLVPCWRQISRPLCLNALQCQTAEENLKSGYLDSHDNSLTCRETNDGNDVCISEALFPASVAFFGVCFSSC